MKFKLLGILLFLMTSSLHLIAQDSTNYKLDSIENKIGIENKSIQFKNSDSTLKMLFEQLQKIASSDRQNAMAIQGLMQGKEIDNLTKYQLVKNNIINATQTYYLLNKKIIDLKSRTTSNDLDVYIASLNNPESKALGFSFSDRALDLVKNIILEGKSDKNEKNKKIIQASTSIINSPIFKSFVSLTPPLAIANSLLTFFQSASLNNKQIHEKNLEKFQQEINKYIVYYNSLNEGNQKFQYGLSFNKDQLNLLYEDMYNHLRFTASALGFNPPPKAKTQNLGVEMNRYFLTFTQEKVQDYFTSLEKEYTNPKTGRIDYERLLRENNNLKEVNNQLEELVLQTKRFENLYNEYFTLVDNYYDKVNSSLQIAADNGLADKNLVIQKQEEFKRLKEEAVNDIKASINIDELKNNTNNIKYRYKIF
ncbi:MAG: hypothetical protein ACYCOO_11620 [Chitinophagaceae bacterium]